MKTILFEKHVALGAKMVDFNGWQMPVHYRGVIYEHKSVRAAVGLFDVSHMGRIIVEGPEADIFLDFLSTNQIAKAKDLTAIYTVFCREDGTTVDDVIVLRHSKERFSVVVNGANRKKDLEHVRRHCRNFDVRVAERYRPEGILAIQGPLSLRVLQRVFPQVYLLKHMRFAGLAAGNDEIIVSKTGYTGEEGFEIISPHDVTAKLWDRILEEGRSEGILPCGLGARDTLRLEMGYALYGHELADDIAPIESVASWTSKWDKEHFLGREALHKLADSRLRRYQYGVIIGDGGIARAGSVVQHCGEPIGTVTSGSFGPSVDKTIAIIMVTERLKESEKIDVIIRDRPCTATVVPLPFLTKATTRS